MGTKETKKAHGIMERSGSGDNGEKEFRGCNNREEWSLKFQKENVVKTMKSYNKEEYVIIILRIFILFRLNKPKHSRLRKLSKEI